jgi:hypothetical protein
VNISELQINPSATCGDDPTASTGGYRVETSGDGTTWITAAAGNFADGTVASTPDTGRHHMVATGIMHTWPGRSCFLPGRADLSLETSSAAPPPA